MPKRGPELLRSWREARGWTQVQLARHLGLSVARGVDQNQLGQKICRWETGERRPSLDDTLAIERLCKIAPRAWQRTDGFDG